MLAKEPSHGYHLGSRLRRALGPLGKSMNAGQVYVTLARLEKAGLVVHERADGLLERPDRKVYALTPAGKADRAVVRRHLKRTQDTELHLRLRGDLYNLRLRSS
jgi:DNA-binding PadR family transcriptional regulator